MLWCPIQILYMYSYAISKDNLNKSDFILVCLVKCNVYTVYTDVEDATNLCPSANCQQVKDKTWEGLHGSGNVLI